MKLPGPYLKDNEQANHLQQAKAMAKIMGKSSLEHVPMPRAKRKDIGARRASYAQPEAILRREAIKWLRKQGFKVWRIENAVLGHRGLPDILFFKGRVFSFCELKSEAGVLKPEQFLFQKLCKQAGIPHFVCRSVHDLCNYISFLKIKKAYKNT